jgi:hypothetical protein
MSRPTIDVGILTIREDEFGAVLKAFPDDPSIYKGRHREYALRSADAGQAEARHTCAVINCGAVPLPPHGWTDPRPPIV